MPSRSTQLPRAASLIISSLGFIHDLRTGTLEPDTVRGIPLDMDQYSRLFGTARIPTDHGCRMETASNSKQIIVLRRGQFCAVPYRHPINPIADDHTFPSSSQIGLTSWMSRTAHFLPNAKCFATCKRLSPMRTNCQHPRSLEMHLVFSPPMRRTLSQDRRNAACLRVVDQALFVVCLDDAAPEGLAELCGNFLCGTYRLVGGVQVGTCTNRWYDKVRACLPGGHSINWNHDTCFILPAATDHCDG